MFPASSPPMPSFLCHCTNTPFHFESFYLYSLKMERKKRRKVTKPGQWLYIPALKKSQGPMMPFCVVKPQVHLFFVSLFDFWVFSVFVCWEWACEKRKSWPTKLCERLKSTFPGSVNGNCFPSLKIATFKLTIWGRRNHKYELLFRQQTAFGVFLFRLWGSICHSLVSCPATDKHK